MSNNFLNLQEIDQEQALHLTKFFIRSNQNVFFFGRRGIGKQLSLDTELPTPTGFIKLSALKEGDKLFDEQGNICNVTKLHPINLSPESYEIEFDDGTKVEACADHLWLTWDHKARKYKFNLNTKFKPQIRTTKEIFQTLKTNHLKCETNHSIPCSKPINYPKKKLLIDPYVLGCWLGDGTASTTSITSADEEILQYIVDAGYSIKLNPSSAKENNKSKLYKISSKILPGHFKAHLRALNCLKNKHIPDDYLYCSYEQRLALLQGLLDTDGSCLKSGLIEFCTVLPALAKQVCQLIRSLGIKTKININESWLYNKRCKDRYRITFTTQLPVFKLKRKLNNLRLNKNHLNRTSHRYIINVKLIDSKPMRCITVNSPSHLFLITRSFIPTHNTFIAMQAAKECNYKINYINLSVIERPDLAGYPNMNMPGETITFKSPHFLPALLENAKADSIILFDEVDKAPAEVTAPLLEILQFRRINGKRINTAGCILTGNLANEGAYSNIINSALLDRAAKYVLNFNFEKWIDWAKANNIHDLILGFLRSNPNLACGRTDDTSYASPSPRGWTLASEALEKAKELKILDIDTVVSIISGFVGNSAGLQFKIWYEYYRKYEQSVHMLIDTGSMKLDFSTLNITERAVFVISCCQYAKQKAIIESKKPKPKFVCLDNLCSFFLINNVDKEIQTMGLYNSFDFKLVTQNELYKSKSFFELFTRLTENISIKK